MIRRTLPAALAGAALLLAGCSNGEDEAAAKACTLFEDSVNSFLVLAEDGMDFEPSTVRQAIAVAGDSLGDAVDAAPASLATDMRDAQELVQLYAQSLAIGRSTDDVGNLMFGQFKDVKAGCGEAGAPIDYPPSFND